MPKVVETNIFGRSSRQNTTNIINLLTYIQQNIETLVGILNEKDGMEDPGIKWISILKLETK